MDRRSQPSPSLLTPFKNGFDLGNPLVTDVIAQCQRFAVRSSAEKVTVNTGTMVLAALSVGRAHQVEGNEASPLGWLVEWLDAHGYDVASAIIAADNQLDFNNLPIEIDVEQSLIEGPIRAAASLARQTVRNGRSGVRQLILALLKSEKSWSEGPAPSMMHHDRVALWDHLIERIIANYEEDDLIEGWQALRGYPGVKVSGGADAAIQDVPVDTAPAPEAVRAVADEPAKVDQLGRNAFARVLAERLTHACEPSGRCGALMAHLHGPWGYGKSSVLNLLREELEHRDVPWLVVDFNAWKHQRLRPPWWSLLSTVYSSAVDKSDWRARFKLRLVWWGWRARADWLPTLLAGLILVAAAAGLIRMLAEPGAQIVAGLLTIVAGLFAYIRLVLIGSAKAAAAYSELKADPFDPIITLYGRLVKATGRPVAVFVDDLDRCSSGYVVELIEGIQTLFRSQAVTYVIAADRAWIAAAFEEQYNQFSRVIGEPGRPLGHLFLDKLFQISASLPDLSVEFRENYWRNLLHDGSFTPNARFGMEAAAEKLRGNHSIEDLQQIITAAPYAEQPALRAAAAVEISRPASAAQIEHRLQVFASLIEPNPRAMKRLVNAVGMAQARCFLEGRNVPLTNIARWSMIELRWPLLAEHLVRYPADIETSPRVEVHASRDIGVAGLLHSSEVQSILRAKDMAIFDEAALRALIA